MSILYFNFNINISETIHYSVLTATFSGWFGGIDELSAVDVGGCEGLVPIYDGRIMSFPTDMAAGPLNGMPGTVNIL